MNIADKTSHFLITQYNATGDYRFEDAANLVDEQAAKIEELEKDAKRYRDLRRMAVELSLSHQVISQFVTNQSELDAAIKGEQAE